MNKRIILFLIFIAFICASATGIDFWRYPEAADKDAMFAGAYAASLVFNIDNPRDFRYEFYFPEFYLDYVLPVGLPFSFGTSLKPLTPDVFGVGARAGYHINLNVPDLNLYVMYAVTFGITSDFSVIEFGPRIGARYRLFSFICLNVETGLAMKTIHFGIAIKLN